MQELEQTFSYTANRGAFWGMFGVIGFLILIESLVFGLLVLIIPSIIVRVLLVCGWLSLTGYVVFGFVFAPLRTRHRLTPTDFIIQYGLDTLVLPRSAILAATPAQEKLAFFQNVRAQLHPLKQRVVACFSEQGQVLLTLREPVLLRIDATSGLVTRLLINIDERDRFLVALNTSSPPPTAPPLLPPIAPSAERQRSAPPPDAPVAIALEAVTRRFGTFTAVDALSIQVRSGEIYGFLGANGAGKTTTMKMMVGLLTLTSGNVRIGGRDVWADPIHAKAAFGYVPDRALVYERLSGKEFLAYLAQLHGVALPLANQRITHYLDLLELSAHADRPASAYSFGMKRKLALAGALLHQPPVLILDEPLNGLDPRSARRLKDLFLDLAGQGTTVFLSTHDLATAESLCHRVGIINGGRLLAEGSSNELQHLAAAPDLEAVFLSLTAPQEAIP